MSKETVLLLTKEEFNNNSEHYQDEWAVFEDWTDGLEFMDMLWATEDNWNQLVCFQLLVKEARKDE